MVKVAVIVAADDLGLEKVFGMSVVRRLTLLLKQMGINTIHIVGRVDALVPIFAGFFPLPTFHQVHDPESLDRAVKEIVLPRNSGVFIVKANYVIDRDSLDQLTRGWNNGGFCFMAAGGGSSAEGCYIVPGSDLGNILHALLWPDGSEPRVSDRAKKVPGVAGLPYVLNNGKGAAAISEARLVEALSCQTRDNDSLLARYFDRRISRFISRRLAHTSVTPNAITIGGTVIGLIGALLLSLGGYYAQLFGSLIFLFCIIVDGVDGEVARLKLQTTSFGQHLDIITDNIVHFAVFAGIAVGLYRDTGDGGYLYLLWYLFGGFTLCIISVYYCILRPGVEGLKHSPQIVRLMALVSNRDFAYLIVALAAVDRLKWFLMGAAVGTYFFAAVLWAGSLYGKRAGSPQGQ